MAAATTPTQTLTPSELMAYATYALTIITAPKARLRTSVTANCRVNPTAHPAVRGHRRPQPRFRRRDDRERIRGIRHQLTGRQRLGGRRCGRHCLLYTSPSPRDRT